MSEQIGEAVITVRTDGSAATRELGKAGTSGGSAFKSGFTGAMRGLLAAAGIGAIVTGAVRLVSSSLGEAREAQVVGAKTTAIIEATGSAANLTAGEVAKLAEQISLKTGVDDEAIQTGENLLLTFKNVRDEAGRGNDVFSRATAAMVDLSAAGFGSLEGSSKMLGKALNDPIAGISALSRAGVTFTQEQKDTIAAMVETGDVLGAQKLILEEIESQVGGVGEASATSADKARVAWGNLKEQLGTILLPVLDKVLRFLTEQVIPKISEFVEQMSTGKGAGGEFADGLTEVKDAAQGAWEILGPMLGNMAENWEVWGAMALGVYAFNTALLILNSTLLTTPIGWLILALGALALGFIYAYTHSEKFKQIVDDTFASVSMWAGIAAGAIGAAFQVIKDWFIRLAVDISLLPQRFAQMVGAVIGWVTQLGVQVGTGIATLVSNVVGFFTALPGRVIGALAGLASGIVAQVSSVPGRIAAIVGEVVGWFLGLPGRVIGALSGLAGGIAAQVQPIVSRVSGIVADVVGFFTALPGRITGALSGLAGDVAGMFSGIVSQVASIPGDIVALFSGLAGRILNAIGRIDIGSLIDLPSPGGGVPYVPGVATGTSDWPGGLAVVGEEGPELVTMPRHSQVTPADETLEWFREMAKAAKRGGGGEGGGNTFNVMLPTGDPEAAAMAMMNRLAIAGTARG